MQLFKGKKFYSYYYGPMTFEEEKGNYLHLTVDFPKGVYEFKYGKLYIERNHKIYRKDGVGNYIFETPDEVGTEKGIEPSYNKTHLWFKENGYDGNGLFIFEESKVREGIKTEGFIEELYEIDKTSGVKVTSEHETSLTKTSGVKLAEDPNIEGITSGIRLTTKTEEEHETSGVKVLESNLKESKNIKNKKYNKETGEKD